METNTSELAEGPIPNSAVRAARSAAIGSRRPLLEILEEELNIPARELVTKLSSAFKWPDLSWDVLETTTPRFDIISYADCIRRECVLAVAPGNGELWMVLSNPYDADTQSWIEARINTQFSYRIAHRLDILAWLRKHEESMRAMDQTSDSDGPQGTTQRIASKAEDLSLHAISESESPIIKLVNSTLYDALKSRASDIHFEAIGNGLVIKYRIDGVLNIVKTLNGTDFAEQTLSRVKILAELDIAERRIPQDGRFRALHRGREIDFRVSIMPSIHGEDAVVRILDKRSLVDQARGLNLDHLGFNSILARKLRRLAAEPYGMMLATGPTGSGKTTTLYALISEMNQGLDKIITIEDPVEYQLPGVLQIPVNEKKGLTFARGLRSILRHDPDRIMVGEIRDPETAEIAVQSALTGHLVYTTVHANNVVDVIGRLLHMKLDPYSFVSALNGVLAQRLVRLNCKNCSQPITPSAELLADSNLEKGALTEYNFMRGSGCGECRGTGYHARKAIGELLVFNDDLRELIVSRAPMKVFKEHALASGTRFLRDAGLDLVRSGETCLEEVNRVTFVA